MNIKAKKQVTNKENFKYFPDIYMIKRFKTYMTVKKRWNWKTEIIKSKNVNKTLRIIKE